MSDVWKSYAYSYDKILNHLSFYRALVKEHVEAQRDSSLVLDNGCGTGNISVELALAGKTVYAVDSSKDMLKHLEAKKRIHSLKNIRIFKADCHSLQFDDCTFDGVVSNNILYYSSIIPEAYLKEIYRLLKKRGIFSLSSLIKGFDMKKLFEAGIKEFKAKGLMDELSNDIKVVADANLKLENEAKNLYTEEEAASLLKSIGFHVLDAHVTYVGQSFFVIARKP